MDGRRVPRLVGSLLAAGIGAALIAACSADSKTQAGVSSTGGGAGAAKTQAPAGAPAAPDGGQRQVSQPGLDRKLIRTASLELAAPDVVEVTNRAREIASALGGFAGQEEVKADSATLTLHIPSNEFDKALVQLSGLVAVENVRSRSQTAEDVTEQLVDVESRIATQRASVERVRALLARAQTVNEIVQIEGEVTRREADLESLEKRREALTGQVALSTVTVRVSRGEPAPPAAPNDAGGFLTGLAGGWDAFLTAGGVLLRVLGALLPFLAVLGVPGLLALRWWRRRRGTLAPSVHQQATP